MKKTYILAALLTLLSLPAFATVDRIDPNAMEVTPTGSSMSDSLADWLGAFPTSNLAISGGRIVTESTDTVLATDGGSFVRYRAGGTATIPSAANTGFLSGFGTTLINDGAEVVFNSTSKINGTPSFKIKQNDGCRIYSDSSNYLADSSACPALAYNPNFATGDMSALDSRITVTNATTGQCSYFDASGLMQYTATGACAGRVDYDPATHALKGVVRELASTNIKTKSTNIISQATHWVNVAGSPTFNTSAATAPDGTPTFSLMTRTTAGSSQVGGSATVSAVQEPRVASVYAKKGDGSSGYLALRFYLSSYTNRVDATCDLTNGTITMRDNGIPNTYGFAGVEDIGGGVYRCYLGSTVVDDAATGVTFFMSPVNTSTSDVDALSQQIGDSVYLWGAQIERGRTYPSSFIKTDTVAVSREEDVMSITSPYWFNNTVGTYCSVFTTLENKTGQALASSGASDKSLLLFRSATAVGSYDGTNAADYAISFSAEREENKVCVRFTGTSSDVSVNGVMGTSQTFDGDFGVGTSIKLFEDYNGANDAEGWQKSIKYYPYALTDAEMVAETQ